MEKGALLYEGKAKRVYTTEVPDLLVIAYKDDATAFNGQKKGSVSGKGIINNCKTKIILNMEDEEAQRVKTILRLSETEVMNITHFQRGNGLISTNNNNITVEFKASNLEKELITTDRQELLEILKRQDKKVG